MSDNIDQQHKKYRNKAPKLNIQALNRLNELENKGIDKRNRDKQQIINETEIGTTSKESIGWMKIVDINRWASVPSMNVDENRKEEIRIPWNPKISGYQNNYEYFAGIDVHSMSVKVAILGRYKDKNRQKLYGPIETFEKTEDGYRALFEMLDFFNVRRILMEVTGIYMNNIYWRLRQRYDPNDTDRVICMNARELSGLMISGKKNDKIDACRLSVVASIPDILKKSYIATENEFLLRHSVRQLQKMEQEQTKIRNRMKKLLNVLGIPYKFALNTAAARNVLDYLFDHPKSGMEEMLTEFLEVATHKHEIKIAEDLFAYRDCLIPFEYKLSLKEYLVNFRVNEGRKKLKIKYIYYLISTEGRLNRMKQHLELIPGLGEISLPSVLVETLDIQRFPSGKHYVSYSGLGAQLDDSGEGPSKKSPNKHTNRFLFRAFTDAAAAIINSIKRTKDEESYIQHPIYAYAKIQADKNLKWRKTVYKVASKLARICYGVLKNNQTYDPQQSYERRKEINQPKKTRIRHKKHLKYHFIQKQLQIFLNTLDTIKIRHPDMSDEEYNVIMEKIAPFMTYIHGKAGIEKRTMMLEKALAVQTESGRLLHLMHEMSGKISIPRSVRASLSDELKTEIERLDRK